MAKKPSGGDLYHRVAFDARTTENPDSPIDYGNTVSAWAQQFATRAAFIHLRGGEAVIASRLQGRHVQVIRVRASAQTRAVTTDWRARDLNNGSGTLTAWAGPVYAIRDITPSDDRQWLDILVESGVAP